MTIGFLFSKGYSLSNKMDSNVMCVNFTILLDENSSFAVAPEFFPSKYKTIVGSCIFFLLFPFVIFQFRVCPLRSSSVVLLGATLMVVFNIVTQDEAYDIVGLQNNLTSIFLLLGMMLLGEYIDREQVIARILRWILPADLGFPGFLLRSCSLAFLLAAFFTSEGAALMLTPVLLKCWKEHERARGELETLLIGLVTSANLGGASTYFGSVMLALVASKTHQPPYQGSRLDLRTCLKYLLLPAVLCFWVNFALLIFHFQLRSRRLAGCHGACSERRRAEHEPFGVTSGSANPASGNGFLKREQLGEQSEDLYYDSVVFRDDRLAHPPTLETIIEDEVLELPESTAWGSEFGSATPYGSDPPGENLEAESGDVESASRLRSCTASEDLTSLDADYVAQMTAQSEHSSPSNSLPSNVAAANVNASSRVGEHSVLHPAASRGSIGGVSMAEFFGVRLQPFDQETACGSIVLQVALAIVVMAVVVLLLASGSHVYFDPGLIPFAGALLVIFIDTTINRFASFFILRRIDWSVMIIFSALFIWMAGFNNTNVPRWVWYKLGFFRSSFSQLTGTAVFASVLVLTANTFGQVPITIIVLDQLQPCVNQLRLVLYLSWVVSIAGNLTPYSSAASAVVLNRSTLALNYPLTLWGFLRYGIPVSLLLIALGLIVISLLLSIGHF